MQSTHTHISFELVQQAAKENETANKKTNERSEKTTGSLDSQYRKVRYASCSYCISCGLRKCECLFMNPEN